jgi:DNA-binding protein HU-beta
MTKNELVTRIANQLGLQLKQVEAVLDAQADVVTGAIKAGDEVTLPGLGKFSVKDKAAKTGRNPKTGEPIQIAAKRAPAFAAVKALKDAVNS